MLKHRIVDLKLLQEEYDELTAVADIAAWAVMFKTGQSFVSDTFNTGKRG